MLLKTIQVFWLFVGILVGIMISFVTGIKFDLAQVFVTLLLVLLDSSDITISGGSIEELFLLLLVV